ncbi:ABC transporter ATP-binding protein [Geodermatophilus sp. DSM 44513]|uniref:ABC transporter ATP-binding protein n=1 Tax=Geodermatophilus sp. DSM 44513 TaxID=1528104 RepID=UPI00126B8357|nr:dipeptide/oligopeptide/nickel ABC transporter ATP-binding protein [Geodermatophilus sp. DSM 44513]WNV76957.1 dipeptide/oligopeptide/nickel ABC transporter ATP-binding protein [Geodermatophilus sp. DSM 44513]
MTELARSRGEQGTELLRARGVTRRYGRRREPALAGVDLAVAPGERVGVVGESGSGKTTLTRLLLALERCDAGEVTYRGHGVHPGSPAGLRWFRRRVQMIPQDPSRSLNPRMRVGRAVAEPLRCLGIPGDHAARVAHLLVAVGLEPDAADRLPHQFSGGQRQRIAIARALAPRPELVVADEPVSALDVAVRLQVLRLLHRLSAEEGLAMVFVSHDLGVVAHLCSRVLVLAGGACVEEGPVDRVLTAPASPAAAALVAAVPRLALP